MSSVTSTHQVFRPVRQWKPNTPERKEGTKPRRKDFSAANSNPDTGVSLCIPYAYKNIGPKRVFAIFRQPSIIHPTTGETICDVSLGFIERIDIKYRKDGNKCVFIHFAAGRWNDNDTNREVLAAMKTGASLKVVTDEDGHFWKTIISKSQRPADYFEDEVEKDSNDESKDKKTVVYNGENTDGQAVELNDEFA